MHNPFDAFNHAGCSHPPVSPEEFYKLLEKQTALQERQVALAEAAVKDQEELRQEWMRLSSDSLGPIFNVGDQVIVATGLINQGPLWAREVARVIKVAGGSVYVQFATLKDIANHPLSVWIHRCLITDVVTENVN